jgi:hypothetical protein
MELSCWRYAGFADTTTPSPRPTVHDTSNDRIKQQVPKNRRPKRACAKHDAPRRVLVSRSMHNEIRRAPSTSIGCAWRAADGNADNSHTGALRTFNRHSAGGYDVFSVV